LDGCVKSLATLADDTSAPLLSSARMYYGLVSQNAGFAPGNGEGTSPQRDNTYGLH